MQRTIYDNFNIYFPGLAREAVEYREVRYSTDGSYELIVKLKDGSYILYDNREHSFRNLPGDIADISEQDCTREFGFRLKKLMRRKMISQSELSMRTGISESQLSRYINGSNIPSFYKVDRIARALGCSMDDLRYT